MTCFISLLELLKISFIQIRRNMIIKTINLRLKRLKRFNAMKSLIFHQQLNQLLLKGFRFTQFYFIDQDACSFLIACAIFHLLNFESEGADHWKQSSDGIFYWNKLISLLVIHLSFALLNNLFLHFLPDCLIKHWTFSKVCTKMATNNLGRVKFI